MISFLSQKLSGDWFIIWKIKIYICLIKLCLKNSKEIVWLESYKNSTIELFLSFWLGIQIFKHLTGATAIPTEVVQFVSGI